LINLATAADSPQQPESWRITGPGAIALADVIPLINPAPASGRWHYSVLDWAGLEVLLDLADVPVKDSGADLAPAEKLAAAAAAAGVEKRRLLISRVLEFALAGAVISDCDLAAVANNAVAWSRWAAASAYALPQGK
jgi:hypothetical protein